MSKELEEASIHLEKIVQQIEQIKNELKALTLFKQQPTAGEFREKVELRLPNFLPSSYEGIKSICATLTDTLHEACDIIDTAEASWKELLEACEDGLKDLGRLMMRLDTSEVDGTIKKMQVVIAKAKQ